MTTLDTITPDLVIEQSKLYVYQAYGDKVWRCRVPIGPTTPEKGTPMLAIETGKDTTVKGRVRTTFRLVNEKEERGFIVTTFSLGGGFTKYVNAEKCFARVSEKVLQEQFEIAVRDNLYFVLVGIGKLNLTNVYPFTIATVNNQLTEAG